MTQAYDQIPLGHKDKSELARLLSIAQEWGRSRGWLLGVAEMALGAAALQYGISIGTLEMGAQLVGSAMSTINPGGMIGAGIGGTAGLAAAAVIGSIGVAAMGGAIGVPAALLAGGAAAVLGLAGYAVGDLGHGFLHQPDLASFFGGGSLLALGVTMLVTGARRILRDEASSNVIAHFESGVLHLGRLAAPIIASTREELALLSRTDAAAILGPAAAAGVGGTAIGSALAAGSVTVLGSSTLGSMAVALGLVSAPLWPAIAVGVLAAGGVGAASWYGLRVLKRQSRRGSS